MPKPSKSSMICDLEDICPGGVKRNVSLSEISRWRVGGTADIVVCPANISELQSLRRYLTQYDLPHLVIGGTTNLLFADAGLRALCIQIGSRLSDIYITNTEVYAEAGVWVPRLARRIMEAGLTGAEHICGIPGTLGGLICMNGGSQRKSIGDSVIEVISITPSGEFAAHLQASCGFGYRQSVFQDNNVIIAGARMRFDRALNRREIRREMISILTNRRLKFPRKSPNCGSVFKSNPKMYEHIGPPGAIITALGFKGRRVGGAVVSAKHANFILTEPNARAGDVLSLIGEISTAVERSTGYRLEAEVRFVEPNGRILPADRAAGGEPHSI